MRVLVSVFSLFFFVNVYSQSADFYGRVDAFFGRVVKDGRVAYAELKTNRAELDALVLDVSQMRIAPAEKTQLKAFYINAYNLLVIKQVVDLYPIESPLKVKGFFDGISHSVMGTLLTLDQLEKEVLYAKFPDPRLHFVLVCAAKGCPPISGYSYKPATLNEQLNARTTEVLNMDWFIRVDTKNTTVSQIFGWYEADFLARAASVQAFINLYRTEKISERGQVKFYNYDWSLNE